MWATCIFHITYPRYPYSCVSNQGLNLYYLVGCFLTQTFQLYIYMEMYFGVVVVLFIHIWKCIVMSCLTMLCCLKKKTRLSTSVNISNVHVNVMCFAHESSDVILMILQKDSPCGIPCLEIVRCIPWIMFLQIYLVCFSALWDLLNDSSSIQCTPNCKHNHLTNATWTTHVAKGELKYN